jgi:hypothetical protein
MGSFINAIAKVDPIQMLAGKNSFIAKQDSYDPLMKNTDAGQAYAARHNVTSTPTPYAGVTPTLGDALAGYKQNNPAVSPVATAAPNANAYVQQSQKVFQQQQKPQVGWNGQQNPYGSAAY